LKTLGLQAANLQGFQQVFNNPTPVDHRRSFRTEQAHRRHRNGDVDVHVPSEFEGRGQSSRLIIGENCKSADWLSCERLFVAVKAELVIELFDLTGETAGTPFFSASIGDAFLTEFTADPVTEEVKFVPGGETWCLKQHPTVAEIKVVE
jgi:hypothetical protein